MPTTTTRARRASIFWSSWCTRGLLGVRALDARTPTSHSPGRRQSPSALDLALQDLPRAALEKERRLLDAGLIEEARDAFFHLAHVLHPVRVAARGVVIARLEELLGGAARGAAILARERGHVEQEDRAAVEEGIEDAR